MCLFPIKNTAFDSLAYKKGVTHFDCGACPECMRKRSNTWALRAVYEAKAHAYNCMITLTYDDFRHDEHGNIVKDRFGNPVELPVNPDIKVDIRHIQLFMKRLRKWQSSFSQEKIKFMCCAEYGNRTHRAHYHLILFGVRFSDIHFYKKSKRGNVIYMSKTLTDLWKHGICTVDSIHVHSAIARYCTKYLAKSRSDDTFFTCSREVGLEYLMKDFNGLNYMIDGREYTIPRFVWEHRIISNLSPGFREIISPKYVNRSSGFDLFEIGNYKRRLYRNYRDRVPEYVRYLDYWSQRSKLFESRQLPVRTRILQLNDDKFHFYKISALKVYDYKRNYRVFLRAPGSNCGRRLVFQSFNSSEFIDVDSAERALYYILENPVKSDIDDLFVSFEQLSFADNSRLNTANDTNLKKCLTNLKKCLTKHFVDDKIDREINPYKRC